MQKGEYRPYPKLKKLILKVMSRVSSLPNNILKNWIFQTVVLEKTPESPLYSTEIKPGNPEGNQLWIFIGRTDAEAAVIWQSDAKSWLSRKDPNDWERLRAGGKGGSRGWDNWLASLTQWTWIWAKSRRQWRTGKPGVLQSMRLQSQTRLSNWTATMT